MVVIIFQDGRMPPLKVHCYRTSTRLKWRGINFLHLPADMTTL